MNQAQLGTTWDRLKNNLTFRVGTVFAGASWFLVEATDTFGASTTLTRSLALVLAAAFVILIPIVWLWERRAIRQRAAAEQADLHWGLGGSRGHRRRPGTRQWLTAVVTLTVVAGGLWAFRSRAAGGDVPEAAQSLAVLPFHATGSDEVREFGQGMVDLLTAALSDVGGIRTVPGRTVLARVRKQGNEAELPQDVALEIGRDIGAASVLTGSITAFGTNVRLTAGIHTVTDGALLASANVTGVQDNILDLTDQLALALLRDLWQSRSPLPTVRIAALTTSSPTALKEYLRGEKHLREVRMDSAAHWFRRAVETDSTFALAWLRLAEAAGWLSGAGEDVTTQRQYAARSLALADRLPERERSYARAENLRLAGSFDAFDSLASYVRRYPDDPIGWYKLGDIRFHAGYLGLYREDDIIRPFLESTRLDPALGIGLFHVLEMARDRGDRVAFDSALTRFALFAPANRVDGFRRQASVRWAAPDSVVSAFVAAIRPLHPVEQRVQINGVIGALGRKARLDPDVDPMVYPEALDSLRRIFPDDRYFQLRAADIRTISLAAYGRGEEALRELDRWLALEPDNVPPLPPPLKRAFLRVSHAVGGVVPPTTVADDVRLLEENAQALGPMKVVLEQYYINAGDAQRAARYQTPVDSMVQTMIVRSSRQVDTAAFRIGLNGWLTITHGDTAAGLAEVDVSIRRLGFIDANYLGFPWAEYAMMLVALPDRRAQAIRMLQWQAVTSAWQTGQTFLSLGRALEAEGDNAGARQAYSHVLRLWEGADPYRRASVEEARQALARLTPDRR